MVFLFSVPAYFILLRETLEATIIIAVLLGFIDKLNVNDSLKKKFKKDIWIGSAIGLGVSLLISIIFIIIFYVIAKNLWEDSENAWEGSFSLIASVIITFMALNMIRVQQWRTKWENKLKDATDQYVEKHESGNRWALILLPFTVVCREGVEAIVFIAGIGFNESASGLPIPIITGLLSGFFIGYLIYKGSHTMSLKVFFVATTILLLFIAAGLFSNSVNSLQLATSHHHDDDVGVGEKILWKVNCCDPGDGGFWQIMNSIFGWKNEATVVTTAAYFVYWFVVGLILLFLWYKERCNNQAPDDLEVTNEKDEKEGHDDRDEKTGQTVEITA